MTASNQPASSNTKGIAVVLAAGFAVAFAPIVIAMLMASSADAFTLHCPERGYAVICSGSK